MPHWKTRYASASLVVRTRPCPALGERLSSGERFDATSVSAVRGSGEVYVDTSRVAKLAAPASIRSGETEEVLALRKDKGARSDMTG